MTKTKRRRDALKGKSYCERAVDFLNGILQGEASREICPARGNIVFGTQTGVKSVELE